MNATKQAGPWTDAEVQREKRNGVPCVVLTVAGYEKQQAVASEILAALEGLRMGANCFDHCYEIGLQNHSPACVAARAAIAKAEGR